MEQSLTANSQKHSAPSEQTFLGRGGLQIFYRSWYPAEKPRGVVAIVPGFNSHSGYYFWAAEQLVDKGFAVYAVDLRGRGRSEGERFYVDSFSDYTSDVEGLVQVAKKQNPDLPIFLLGHSAGGVISCGYTLEHQSELAGFICEDFAFQIPAPDVALEVLKGLSRVAPHGHILKLSNKDFSRDLAVVEKMDTDPLIANETQPNQTIAEMVRADERLKKDFPLIQLPVFIMHGTADKVTKPSGSQFFYDHAGSSDKTLKLYEGYYHDMLNDLGKEAVMTDILAWIDVRLKASSGNLH